jgi:hypothetical protein
LIIYWEAFALPSVAVLPTFGSCSPARPLTSVGQGVPPK